jgi:hypothetical protein
MRKRKWIAVLWFIAALALPACGGRLYKVTPTPAGESPAGASESAGGLRAVALDGDRALERFEANLPLAGVVAVDVRLENTGAETRELSGVHFDLQTADGKSLKPLTPRKALGAVMKYYGNRFYTLAARQKTREDYESVALQPGGLASGEVRRGILFFQTDRAPASLEGLSLLMKGSAAPVRVPVSTQ